MTTTSSPISGRDRPGLFSLAQIQYLLRVEFGRAQRYGHPVLALLVAVDRLDELCERLGYEAKERALDEVVHVLQRETRPFDFLGRLHEDRLLLVAPYVRPEHASPMGARLVHQARLLELGAIERGLELRISMGGGLMSPGETLFYDELLSSAERGLAQAIAAGGDRCVVIPASARASGA